MLLMFGCEEKTQTPSPASFEESIDEESIIEECACPTTDSTNREICEYTVYRSQNCLDYCEDVFPDAIPESSSSTNDLPRELCFDCLSEDNCDYIIDLYDDCYTCCDRCDAYSEYWRIEDMEDECNHLECRAGGLCWLDDYTGDDEIRISTRNDCH